MAPAHVIAISKLVLKFKGRPNKRMCSRDKSASNSFRDVPNAPSQPAWYRRSSDVWHMIKLTYESQLAALQVKQISSEMRSKPTWKVREAASRPDVRVVALAAEPSRLPQDPSSPGAPGTSAAGSKTAFHLWAHPLRAQGCCRVVADASRIARQPVDLALRYGRATSTLRHHHLRTDMYPLIMLLLQANRLVILPHEKLRRKESPHRIHSPCSKRLQPTCSLNRSDPGSESSLLLLCRVQRR